jgi:Tfp pilus assembly protein PilX
MRVSERLRTRAADESGFTMIIAMMVLMVVTLLIGAAFVAANGDVDLSKRDTDTKRAYYAARAGLSAFLYQLNKNTELWQTCPSKTTTTINGSGGATYSYAPLPANGQSACSTTNAVGTFIDLNTGTFRMKFTGTAGTPAVSRSIVAQFKRQSPLDYLYYSKYETLDPNTYSDPSSYQVCASFIRDGRPSKCGFIQWVSGDTINGPLYTQDQYYVCGSPTFGRAGSSDVMASAAPVNNNDPVGHGAIIKGCAGNPTYNGASGNPKAGAGTIDPPSDNTNLLPYAQTYGKTYTGRTEITISGTQATIKNNGATSTVNLATYPLIYVGNGSGCSATYSPYFNGTGNYTNSTSCGNVLIKTATSTGASSSYTTSFTIAAANDIIIAGDLKTNLSGSAVAGLVANNFIRVMHGVNRSSTSPQNCGFGSSNISGYTLNDPEIDAAILALQHSFIVDNYDCGSPPGYLNVNGAIAQIFRGTVGTGSGGSASTGYLKNYNYDDRLAVLQPPFLFDLASSAWRVVRETGCLPGSTDPTVAC